MNEIDTSELLITKEKLEDMCISCGNGKGAGVNNSEDEFCPVCGYYCTGKGGIGCIDKPSMCKEVDHE